MKLIFSKFMSNQSSIDQNPSMNLKQFKQTLALSQDQGAKFETGNSIHQDDEYSPEKNQVDKDLLIITEKNQRILELEEEIKRLKAQS